jgi:hypothetical protein
MRVYIIVILPITILLGVSSDIVHAQGLGILVYFETDMLDYSDT